MIIRLVTEGEMSEQSKRSDLMESMSLGRFLEFINMPGTDN